MSQPVIDLQLRHNEIEIKFLSFDEAELQTVLDMIEAASFDSTPLRGWLVPYGDPTKSNLYRYGLPVPEDLDADAFTTWLVEQLRSMKLENNTSFRVNHLPKYERTPR